MHYVKKTNINIKELKIELYKTKNFRIDYKRFASLYHFIILPLHVVFISIMSIKNS